MHFECTPVEPPWPSLNLHRNAKSCLAIAEPPWIGSDTNYGSKGWGFESLRAHPPRHLDSTALQPSRRRGVFLCPDRNDTGARMCIAACYLLMAEHIPGSLRRGGVACSNCLALDCSIPMECMRISGRIVP